MKQKTNGKYIKTQFYLSKCLDSLNLFYNDDLKLNDTSCLRPNGSLNGIQL